MNDKKKVNLLPRHILQLITTGHQPLDQVQKAVTAFPPGMVDMLQIREKKRTARELLEWHQICAAALSDSRIIINDRVDVAAAVHASGVQLGFNSITPAQARKILPQQTRVGCSVHSIEEAQQAHDAGADFLIYGHIYSTASKPGLEPRGIEALQRIVNQIDLPIIAIGGIQPHLVEEVLSTGCSGIAVMSSVFAHPQPNQQVSDFRAALDCTAYTPRYFMETD
jgi:thiazole tautomerase (transcriptional regulator TenI)